MGFIIGRFEKLQKNISALAEADRHNNRDENYSLCPNIDSDRTELNEHYVFNDWGLSVVDTYEKCIKKLKRKPRKDHIMAFELFFGYSPEVELDVGEFRDLVIKYLNKKFEGCPFCVDLHMDETTPHIHVIVIPCKLKDGQYRFCGSDYRSKKEQLYQFQDEIFQEIGKPLGLERGTKGSKDKHKEITKYYEEIYQKQLEEYEVIRQENNMKLQKLEEYGNSLDAEINKYKYDTEHDKVLEFQKMILEYIEKLENEIKNSIDNSDIVIYKKCLELLMTLLHKHKLIKYKNSQQQER